MFPPNVAIKTAFRHASGTTGVADASWTKKAFLDGKLRTTAKIAVRETSGGYYYCEFTPDAEGLWVLDVFVTASAATHYLQDRNYHVFDIVAALGGQGFDDEKHALTKLRAMLQSIRDEQERAASSPPRDFSIPVQRIKVG